MPNANELDNSVANLKVGFKLGLQADMDTLLSQGTSANAVHGSFYLTQDTHRLYVGNADHSISSVNQGVRFVTNTSQLPSLENATAQRAAQGQFYYITNSNILCVASGAQWVQINPDTRISSYSVGSSQVVDQGSSSDLSQLRTDIGVANATGVKVTSTIQEEILGASANAQPQAMERNFILASGSSNIHINKVTGTGENGKTYIAISSDAGDVYRLATTTITDSGANGVKVTLYSSSNDTYNTANPGSDQNSGTFSIFGDSNTNTIVPTISNGKVVLTGGGVNDMDWDISEDSNIQGKFHIKLKDSNNQESGRLSFQPVVTLGTNAQEYEFAYSETVANDVKLTANLPVYTKDEVDDLITDATNGIDGMHFAGTIGTSTATYATLADLRAAVTSLGDGATFKITDTAGVQTIPNGMTIEGFNSSTDTMEVGDMIIITGDETDGHLNGTNLKYTYIPSGNDFDEYYTPDMATSNSSVTFTAHSDNNQVHTLAIAAGRGSSATGANATASSTPPVISYTNGTRTKTIYIDHAVIDDPTVTQDTSNAINPNGTTAANIVYNPSFDVITAITEDNGHITGYTVRSINIVSKEVSDITKEMTSITNGIKFKDKISLSGDSAVQSNDIELSSTSLVIASATPATNGNIAATIDLVWGTF